MTLIGIKQYLQTVKIASLAKMVEHFQCDVELLRCMMKHWLQKGNVRCFSKTTACGKTCGKCDIQQTEIYEWV